MKGKSIGGVLSALLMMLVMFGEAKAEDPYETDWIRQLGTTTTDTSRNISVDGLGNIYICGYTNGTLPGANPNAGSNDAFVSKYSNSGTWQWTRQLGSVDSDVSRGVSADDLGNVYICGYTNGTIPGAETNAGSYDAFISKYDSSGTLHWTHQLGTTSDDQSLGISADGLGNVYITGYTSGSLYGTNFGSDDAFVAKYNSAGEHQWTRQLGTSEIELSYGISADGLGNVYITGITDGALDGSNAGGHDAFVAKYNNAGEHQWTRQLGTSGTEYCWGVSADGLGNVYISGYTDDSLDGITITDGDAFIAKYNSDGISQWVRQTGAASGNCSYGVSADDLGNIYISGETSNSLEGTNFGLTDAFVIKYASNGDQLWTRQIGTTGNDRSYGPSADGVGNVYISGKTEGSLDGTNAGGEDAFVAKFSPTYAVPESTDNTVETNMDVSYIFIEGDFPFSDDNVGDSLAAVKITQLETVGDLKLDGVDVALGQEISTADIIAGNLIFEPITDEFGTPYDSFRFMVSDGEHWSYSDYLMTINVLVPPVADAGPDQLLGAGVIELNGGECTADAAYIIMDGSASIGNIVSYEWSWNQESCGYIATNVEPTAALRLPTGIHVITLTVTDNIGQTDTDTALVAVWPAIPGDVDNSGTVNLSDFVILRNHFGESR